jgi:hypothetical protein
MEEVAREPSGRALGRDRNLALMNPDPSCSLRFTTERFDYTSTLPPDSNAGNQFYGRDVAVFLVEGLTAAGLAAGCCDEDWGWLVFPAERDEETFEIGVYNLAEQLGSGARGINQWGLWIRGYHTTKLLGLIPKRREVAPPAALLAAIEAQFSRAGIALEPWDDAPDDTIQTHSLSK